MFYNEARPCIAICSRSEEKKQSMRRRRAKTKKKSSKTKQNKKSSVLENISLYILRPLFHLYQKENQSENVSFIKNQIKWAISSSMVSKEVCSWPGESAWPHLTGGADGGGQNVWVQGSSYWTWSSPASPRVGTSLSGCWMAAPPCERDRSQQSA